MNVIRLLDLIKMKSSKYSDVKLFVIDYFI